MFAHLHPALDRHQHVLTRTQEGFARFAIDNDRIAFGQAVTQARQTSDTGDLQRPRHNGGVTSGRAFFKQQAFQLGTRIFQQVGRAEITRHQNGIVRQLSFAGIIAHQDAQQAVGQILEIVKTLANIGVAGTGKTGAVFVTHTIHGSFGCQARAYRLFERAVPAPVVGEHAIGFQHLVRGAAQLGLTTFEQGVNTGFQCRQTVLKTAFLDDRIIGQQFFGRDRSFVQNRPAHSQTFGKFLAGQAFGPVRRQFDIAQFGIGQKTARGHRFRQHHGDVLDVFQFVLVIDAGGAVLDDQHTDGAATAQQRGPQEGIERIFARFRTIGEVRVFLRIRQADRLGEARDLADQTLAGAQARIVNGFGVQTLGGEQFKLARCPSQIDGADLGHHGAGDNAHHHVQPLLGTGHGNAACPVTAGQGLADLAQQVPWTPCRQSRILDHDSSRSADWCPVCQQAAPLSLSVMTLMTFKVCPDHRPHAGRAQPVRHRPIQSEH